MSKKQPPATTLAQRLIYQHLDYKAYLRAWIAAQPGRGRGIKALMASELRCNAGFISRVLSGDAHFSFEQIDRLHALLGHDADEKQFFVFLVMYGRAGTESLRQNTLAMIRAELEKQRQLGQRLLATTVVSRDDHAVYYSSWAYVAVHMYLTIPPWQTPATIVRGVGVSPAKVKEILEFLVSRGLARADGDRYTTGSAIVHLENESSMITRHHLNWRLRAMHQLEQEGVGEMHYSGVAAIAREDAARIRVALADAIANMKKIIDPSREEALYTICLDFFPLGRNPKSGA